MKLDRRKLVTGTMALGIAAGLDGYFGLNGRSGFGPASAEAAAADADPAELAKPGPMGDMALGEEDAPVTIVEYASMTCPHCANFHTETFPKLKEEFIDTGKVRFVFREFPFDDLALAAFMVARCAPEDKYFPMIDILFEQQSTWAGRGADPREELFKIAKLSGMTREKFDACLKDEEIARGIMAVRERGANEFGIDSTPTFFVNGKLLSGNRPLEEFENAINAALG
ncbi:DsbA family protein [Kaustia mangrovi]|uniref:DsbA family protein n=1 Tax=Kaustia mangrovi TaxID=2593653 RepID=A0A7S8C2E1_9HYPH|nr:DsbA family protein [Kaustia mangrovi]QPC42113.1 DsbA family protein [Kaustia mangrovi]